MKLRFFHKLFGLALGLALAVLGVSTITFFLTAEDVLVRGLGDEALGRVLAAIDELKPAQFAGVFEGSTEPGEDWQRLVSSLAEIQSRLGPAGVENVYVIALRDGTLFVVGDPTGDDPPFTVQDTVYVELKTRVLASGIAESTPTPYTDEYGTWVSGYAPIRAGGDRVVAILGADLPLGAFPLARSIVARTLAFSLLPALLLAALASILFSRRLTRPVQEITAGLRRVQQGDLDTELTVTSGDEFGDIAEAFNEMTKDLAGKARLGDMFAQSVSAEVAELLLSGEISTGGELKEVTVLFSDIRGFTQITESMAARNVIEMLNEYFSLQIPCVDAYGGIVDKLVGDELFAVFGAPLDLEDDALAAVQSALAMRSALDPFNAARLQRSEKELSFGIGISTGAVVAGRLGTENRRNYTVLGNTVNVGARLCSSADPGQILISGATYLRVKNRVEVNLLPPLQVKGITFPLDVFEVISLRES